MSMRGDVLKKWRKMLNSSAFAKNKDGIAAVEFALVVPIAVVLLIGGVDYSDAISIQRKITLADRTVTDLVTQYTNIDTTTLALNLAASASIVAPYSSANLVMTVTEVTTDAAGLATVKWSQSYNGTKRAIGSTLMLPLASIQPNATLIFGEASYTDNPAIGYAMTGTINLHDSSVMSPRLVTLIPCSDCT